MAGHIDHGKTSFIKSINNYDGDVRSDEKERGMTIDLSFSSVVLGQNHISFIDVPGHEKLVKNMIAGAFGIDVLALILALDDGIMPQSLEHLHIAHLLGIKRIIVFLTKRDLVDSKRYDDVKSEITNLLHKLAFDIIAISGFSVNDIDSINRAKKVLSNLVAQKRDSASPFFRYYCDRVFSKKGFGTIVTGSVLSGDICVGDKVFISDLGREVVVKNIHNHDKDILQATLSQRAALHLSNVSVDEIKKGMLLSKKGILRGFSKVDCVIFPLEHINNGQNAVLFIGSKRLNATIQILESSDNMAYVTIKTDDNIFSVFKERFILRDNAKTIGGGMILNPISDPMKKAQKLQYLHYLMNDDFINAFNILVNAHKQGFGLIQSLQRFNLTRDMALNIAKQINDVFVDTNALVVYSLSVQKTIREAILRLIGKNKNAIFSANSINNQLKWSSFDFTNSMLESLESQGIIKKSTENLYISNDSGIKNIFEYTKESILRELENGDITPESPYNIYDKLDIDRKFGDSVFKHLTQTRKVVRLSHNVFVLTDILNKMVESMRNIIKDNGYIDIFVFKEHYNISRKYIICYLDYLDCFSDIDKIDTKRVLKNASH